MQNQTFIAFDYGERRTGVAVGQSLTQSAQPLQTIESINNQPNWQQITILIDEWKPARVIVGIPGYSQQNKGLRAKIKLFCTQLQDRFNLPVDTHDETLSSDEAYQYLKSKRKISKGKIDKKDIDKVAAAIMLESWMYSNL
ncbi:MAG: Holliday junction resolvase RuvX [Pseudomonadota bacterium]